MVDKRKHKRINLKRIIRVKEDNGELIRFYNISNISENGMFLDKKIKDTNEKCAEYTIILSDGKFIKLEADILDTRKSKVSYGTAVKFKKEIDFKGLKIS